MELAQISDEQIEDAIKEHGGVRGAADALQVPRSSLRRRIERCGIEGPTKKVALVPQRDGPSSRETKPDLSEFIKLTRRGQVKPCRVRLALEGLSPRLRSQFGAACTEDSGIISNQALHLWLERHAGERWTGTWQHCLAHRQEKCSCVLEV